MTRYDECPRRTTIPIQTTKSLNVTKTNTLHQFDTMNIVGVPSPVGKIPILFYMKEGKNRGRRGIIFSGDRDSVCYMFPEFEHAEWCEEPYALKWDKVEPFDNGVESGMRRNHGVLELIASVWRKWYNGQVMFRPEYKLQGCGRDFDGYPAGKLPERDLPLKEVTPKVRTKVKRKRRSCGCGKGE